MRSMKAIPGGRSPWSNEYCSVSGDSNSLNPPLTEPSGLYAQLFPGGDTGILICRYR
jgi:hypothetical protein